jgi:uncharacterized hydrophobic protein (TIGR00271 family)
MDRPKIATTDIPRMADAVLLSYGKNSPAKYSAFWVLLTLAGVIATAGVVSDSTATVIGAMIVAPLMTPILGTAFALVLADRNRMIRSLLVVIGGALIVIAIGFAMGLLDPVNSYMEGNTQISSRVNPKLLDLVAALATGTVGAFALVRPDISDTLPGVAIAISLVPPLAVVGLTAKAGQYDESVGALVLFLTNVTAIIFTATIVLLLYQVRDVATEAGYKIGQLKGTTLAMVVATVLIVAVPLTYSTARLARDTTVQYSAAPLVTDWAQQAGWAVVQYSVHNQVMTVVALGPPPQLSPEDLRTQLDDAGYGDIDLSLELVVGGSREFPGDQSGG